MSANVPAISIGSVPESVPQQSWAPWLTMIARARNLDAATIARSGIANLNGFVVAPPLTLYVRSTGSDTRNNGLSSTQAFATINHAIAVGQLYHVNGGNLVIDIGAGTWTEDIAVSGALWGCANRTSNTGNIVLSGAGSANTTLNSTSFAPAAIIASDHAFVVLTGLKVQSTHGSAVFPQRSATIYINPDVNIGACGLGQLHAETSGIVQIGASLTVSGSAPAFLQGVLGGRIIFSETAITVTFSGTPAFSIAAADIESGSLVYANSNFVTFSGAATGPRFLVKGASSVIETIAGTGTFLPGNALGSVVDGGDYTPRTAPTIGAVTGLGTGGSPGAVLVAGSTDEVGFIQLTTGSTAGTPAATGNVPLTFGAKLGANAAICTAALNGGTANWAAAAAVQLTGSTTAGLTLVWQNNGVALATGSTFFIAYQCRGF